MSDWGERALCRDTDEPDSWHGENPEEIAYAIGVCEGCPVRMQCLDYALTTGQRHGTWGGVHFGGNPSDKGRTRNLQVRIWAARNGWSLPHTGRIPRAVYDGYRKATA
jgi:hypothetical protein